MKSEIPYLYREYDDNWFSLDEYADLASAELGAEVAGSMGDTARVVRIIWAPPGLPKGRQKGPFPDEKIDDEDRDPRGCAVLFGVAFLFWIVVGYFYFT